MAESRLISPRAPKRDYFAAARQRLDQNTLAKETGGFIARRVGNIQALTNAPRDAASDLIEAGAFVGSLLDPEARKQLARTGREGAAYVQDRLQNPRRLETDARALTNHLVRSIIPAATPLSPSFLGELRRSRSIGIQQGKLGIEIGTIVGPGLALKAARAPKLLSVAERIARHEAQGLPSDVAKYLATQPYDGKGLHNVPQRVTKAIGVPKVIADSSFNVRKPKGSIGEAYEEHFKSDNRAQGFKLPRGMSQKGWSCQRVGLERYSLPKALWRNAPTPLKMTGVGGAGLASDTLGQKERER